MKFICVFSSAALVSCLSVDAGVAVAKLTEQVFGPASLSQTESVMIAGVLNTVRDAVQTIEQVEQVVESVNLRVEQENCRRELEAAREAVWGRSASDYQSS